MELHKFQSLYRGYIPLQEKRAMIPFKETSAMTWEEAESYPGADGIGGVLQPTTVVVDIDSDREFNITLEIIKERK